MSCVRLTVDQATSLWWQPWLLQGSQQSKPKHCRTLNIISKPKSRHSTTVSKHCCQDEGSSKGKGKGHGSDDFQEQHMLMFTVFGFQHTFINFHFEHVFWNQPEQVLIFLFFRTAAVVALAAMVALCEWLLRDWRIWSIEGFEGFNWNLIFKIWFEGLCLHMWLKACSAEVGLRAPVSNLWPFSFPGCGRIPPFLREKEKNNIQV